MRWFFLIFLVFYMSISLADDIRIITSFPPNVSNAYGELWKSKNPDSEFLTLNKNTVASIDEIARGNTRGFDVFMASSPEAFELLSQSGAFHKPVECKYLDFDAIEPFALSSIGWARRKDSGVFLPANWNDLTKQLYRNKIAMVRPARSGSSHLMVEQLLQTRGWNEGWAFILSLAGNLSTLTARSFGVTDGVAQGRFEIGLTIDFLAQSKAKELDFRYGRPVMLTSAKIGLLKHGKSPEAACRFLELVLSEEGQSLLLNPDIARIPISPEVRAKYGQTPKEVKDALNLEWISYDARLSARRYWAVNTLFDTMITEVLDERKKIWARLDELSAKYGEAKIQNIRQLLLEPIASELDVERFSSVLASNLRTTRLSGASQEQTVITERWRSSLRDQFNLANDAMFALEREFK